MDKVVDHLFVFRGDAVIEDFPGNYSDFRAYEDSKPSQEKVEILKEDTRVKTTTKVKLTFKEKKEYDAIEVDIEALTTEKSAIEASFLDGDLSGEEINKLSKRIQEISLEIDRKEERWFELSAKMEN